MFKRSATVLGTLDNRRESGVPAIVGAEPLPIWKRMPNALAARLDGPLRIEDGPSAFVLRQEADRSPLVALARAGASPVRREDAPVVEKLSVIFHGALRPIVQERLA